MLYKVTALFHIQFKTELSGTKMSFRVKVLVFPQCLFLKVSIMCSPKHSQSSTNNDRYRTNSNIIPKQLVP